MNEEKDNATSPEIEAAITKYQKEYSEAGFLDKVRSVARKAGIKVIYVALLLYNVLRDAKTPAADKAKIVGALGYFILPLDLLPDALPIVGYTDDLAALYWAYTATSRNVTPELRARVEEQLHKWFGDYDRQELGI